MKAEILISKYLSATTLNCPILSWRWLGCVCVGTSEKKKKTTTFLVTCHLRCMELVWEGVGGETCLNEKSFNTIIFFILCLVNKWGFLICILISGIDLTAV